MGTGETLGYGLMFLTTPLTLLVSVCLAEQYVLSSTQDTDDEQTSPCARWELPPGPCAD